MPLTLSDDDRLVITAEIHASSGLGPNTAQWIERYDERIYLAGMRAGMERAAKVCDGLLVGYIDTGQDYDVGVQECVEAIQALVTPTGPQSA